MVDTADLENYLNDVSAKEGDMIEILGEGTIEQKEDPNSHRKYKVLNLPVRINGAREVIYSPNGEAMDVLNDEWGTNTSNWVGKKFTVKFYPKTVFGTTRTAILPVMIEVTKI